MTGFRVKGQAGIVTALHGVVGCTQFWAENNLGLSFDKDLKVVAVDLDRDVALLWSEQLDKEGKDGFESSNDTLKAARIEGMPQGNKGLGGDVQLNQPPLGPLDPIVDDQTAKKLSDRNSPSLSKNVLRVKGLEPGDSGGPVLDPENHVVAVADGGLKGGASRICWAIPYRDIHWETVTGLKDKSRTRYDNLTLDSGDDLFTYEDDPGPKPITPFGDRAEVEKQLRRIFDGVGRLDWDFPANKGGDGHMWVSGGDETRKFVALEKCVLTFGSAAEREAHWDDADGPPEGPEGWSNSATVTIDLSDVSVQLQKCCDLSDAIYPKWYPKGTPVVLISGIPGFKPISEEASTIQKRNGEERNWKRSWTGWNLYYDRKEAADVAMTALNQAIALCKAGQ